MSPSTYPSVVLPISNSDLSLLRASPLHVYSLSQESHQTFGKREKGTKLLRAPAMREAWQQKRSSSHTKGPQWLRKRYRVSKPECIGRTRELSARYIWQLHFSARDVKLTNSKEFKLFLFRTMWRKPPIPE